MRSGVLFPPSPFGQTLPVGDATSPVTSGKNSLFDLAPKTSFGNSVNLKGTGIGTDKGEADNESARGEAVLLGERRQGNPGVTLRDTAQTSAHGDQPIQTDQAPHGGQETVIPSSKHSLAGSGSSLATHASRPREKTVGIGVPSSNKASANKAFGGSSSNGHSPVKDGGQNPFRLTGPSASPSPMSFLEDATFLTGMAASSGQPRRPLATSAPSPLNPGGGPGSLSSASTGDRSISELFFAKQKGNPAAAMLPTGGFKKEFDSSLVSDTGGSYANSLVGGASRDTVGSDSPYTDSDYYYSDSDSDGDNSYDKSGKTYGDSQYEYGDYHSDDKSEDQYGAPYYDYDDQYTDYNDKSSTIDSDTGGLGQSAVNDNSPLNSGNGHKGEGNNNYGLDKNKNNYKFTEFEKESNSGYAIDRSQNDDYGDFESPSSSNSQQPFSVSRPQDTPGYSDSYVSPDPLQQSSGYIENYNPSAASDVSSGEVGRLKDGNHRGEQHDGYRHDGYGDSGYSDDLHSDSGYSDSGYSNSGHSDDRHSDSGYSDSGYSDSGYSDVGHSDGGHSDGGYSDGGYSDENNNEYSDSEYPDESNTNSGYSNDGYEEKDDGDIGYNVRDYGDNNGHSDSRYIDTQADNSYIDSRYENSDYSNDGYTDSGYRDNRYDDGRAFKNDYSESEPNIVGDDLTSGAYLDSHSAQNNNHVNFGDDENNRETETSDNIYKFDDAKGLDDASPTTDAYIPPKYSNRNLDYQGFRPGISDPGPPKNAYAGDYSDENLYSPDSLREPDIATSTVDAAPDDDGARLQNEDLAPDRQLYDSDVGEDNSKSGFESSGLDSSYIDSDQPPPLDSYPDRGGYLREEQGELPGASRPPVDSYYFPPPESSSSQPDQELNAGKGVFEASPSVENPHTNTATTHGSQSLTNPGLSDGEFNPSEFSDRSTSQTLSSIDDADSNAVVGERQPVGIPPSFDLTPTSLVIVPDENPLILLPTTDENVKPFESKGPQPFSRPR
ncbi:hypothetical protein ElyMa_004774500 [Elysia marginata]|uniref:Uncharacterized protein n=1 Tax=Elysia marginata TaxID=1093978 RepID=A0AAV4IK38_9GAST|nr:hypothetical protein ElyMa_004774500 [Elysia marginata]